MSRGTVAGQQTRGGLAGVDGGTGIQQLTAGANITLTPANGLGPIVEITADGGGSGEAQALEPFANVAALSAFDVTAVADGTVAWVTTLKDFFRLDKTSSATNDTTNFLIVTATTGRWYRAGQPNEEWMLNLAWGIDPTSGNNENVGSVASPLKTFSEWRRRTRTLTFIGNCAVTIAANLASDDPIINEAGCVTSTGGPAGTITISGTATVTASGTISAVTNFSSSSGAGGTQATITDAGTPRTWAAFVGDYIRIFSAGPTFRASAWIAEDLGSNQCRLSLPTNENGGLATANVATIAVGDTYSVYSKTTFYNFQNLVPGVIVTLKDLQMTNASSSVALVNALGSAIVRCINVDFEKTLSTIPEGFDFSNCQMHWNNWHTGRQGTLRGGWIRPGTSTPNQCSVIGYGYVGLAFPLFEDVKLVFDKAQSEDSAGFCFYECVTAESGLACFNCAEACNIETAEIWGSGNTVSGIALQQGSWCHISSGTNLVSTNEREIVLGPNGGLQAFREFVDMLYSPFQDSFGNSLLYGQAGVPSGEFYAPHLIQTGGDTIPVYRVVAVSSAGKVAQTRADETFVLPIGVTASATYNTDEELTVITGGHAIIELDDVPTDGDTVWLSGSTVGIGTLTEPTGGDLKFVLGTVVKSFSLSVLALVRLEFVITPTALIDFDDAEQVNLFEDDFYTYNNYATVNRKAQMIQYLQGRWNSITFTDCNSTASGEDWAYTGAGIGTAETGHPGCTLLTPSAVPGQASIRTGSQAILFGGGEVRMICVFKTDANLSDGTNTYTVRVGFQDSTSGAAATDGAYLRYTHSVNSGKWELVCASNATETTADSGITVAVSTWYQFEVRVNADATSVGFYINNNLVGTITTNIPTGAGRNTGVQAHINSSAGTARTILPDLIGYVQKLTTQRW